MRAVATFGMPRAKQAASRCVEVDLRNVSLIRGERQILHDVSWRVRPGERWVLLGANGAGKTQLLKILAGAVWPTPGKAGQLRWRWRGAWHRSPQDVLDEIAYLGPERQDRYERHAWNHSVREVVGTGVHRSDIPLLELSPAQNEHVARRLRQLRLTRLGSRKFLTLSYGERRRVLLARALATRPGLLLLDELLTGLDATQRRSALAWLEASAASRLSWVLSTHRSEDVPHSATHALVLVAGRVSYCGAIADVNWAPELQFADSRLPALKSLRAPRPPRRRSAQQASAQPWFQFHDASIFLDYKPIIVGLNWQVREGECWIVRGANGAGKSSLLRAIYGDYPVAAGGSLRRRGIVAGVPLEEFKKHCGIVAPHLQAEHPRGAAVLEVVISGLYSSIGLNQATSLSERRLAARALARVNGTPLAERSLADLSYGEVRRVLFARALVHQPQLLLLDEAFAGLDVATRRNLLALVDDLLANGTTVILATHHREELPRLASHELLLCAGRAERATVLSDTAVGAQ